MIGWINTIIYCLFINFGCYHHVHVSVANVEYLTETGRIKVSIKVGEDDFRLLFFHLNQVEIDLKTSSNYTKFKDLILPYFDNNFKIEVNNKEVLRLEPSDWKIDVDDLWFYFEVPVKEKINELKIINTLFLDLYFDQKNLVILKINKMELGYQFDYKITEKEILLLE